MATTNSTPYTLAASSTDISLRDSIEMGLGFLGILTILWLPTHEQLIFGPIALVVPLLLVVARRPTLNQLGFGFRGFSSSLWILPAAATFAMASVLIARDAGTLHGLYQADFSHVGGYVLWTIYQQFLLQDFFMPRLTRVLNGDFAVFVAALLFAVAHLPNITLTIATLIWGAVSCLLFRRYRNLYVIGVAQGLLGICFAMCIPDALHHHMRVGLGYLHYVAH